MNTIFTRELEKICKDMDMLYDCRFAGNVFIGRLTDETIAKIFFDTSGIRNEYDRIHMKIVNTRLGEVNSQSVFVSDVSTKASRQAPQHIYRPKDLPDGVITIRRRRTTKICEPRCIRTSKCLRSLFRKCGWVCKRKIS